ncbi:MAG: fatty acid desaturase [Boseongicola sp.]|nr:fatty acid desaturase [Boseongicola sp.]
MREFSGMEKYTRMSSWIILAGYFLQYAAAVAVGTYLLGLDNLWVMIPGLFMVLLFLGTRMRALNNIVHECSHSTFSVVREDNARIGSICSAVLFGSFKDYRDEHLTHHAHVGDYEQDLDLQGIEDLRLHDPLTPRVILRHIVTPLIGRHLPYYLSINLSDRDGAVYQALKFAVIIGTGMAMFFAPLSALLFILVPFFIVYSTLNYWADCMDHAGLVPTDDDLYASRNILAPKLLRWIFFPRNDCYHLVHHLFPQVPARHLPVTHDALMSDDMYSAQSNAVRAIDQKKGIVPAE